MEIVSIVDILSGAMLGTAAVSAIAGAALGIRRKTGGARGFLLGLLLPVVGVGIVAISGKAVRDMKPPQPSVGKYARERARTQFQKEHPNGSRRVPDAGQRHGTVLTGRKREVRGRKR